MKDKQNLANKEYYESKICERPTFYNRGKYDFKGLRHEVILLVIVNAFNLSDLAPNINDLMEVTGWTRDFVMDVKKLIHSRVKAVNTFREDGTLAGKGFVLV
jgi:hypothetical protein